MLLKELILKKNIVIINFSMYIKVNVFSKPNFILIPKPTPNMIYIFNREIQNCDNLSYYDDLSYNELYNNTLRQIGLDYIKSYDKIITFCNHRINVYDYLIKINIFSKLLNADIIKYISKFVPFIYESYTIYKIPQSCKKCYDKYHAGIITNYHMVENSDMCGLCNYYKFEHISNAQICPPKYKSTVCGCNYSSTNCICKSIHLTPNHNIIQIENKFNLKINA
jgi:hypothetical protein